ncbi:trem-like transcript 4 protein isoform X1 [Hyaena hyaena]|uniref:trem-like transcript 4 protein isoform X1 n=1 Tax=Hyaena hyaena TaxID=95912 RepID=UPI001923C3D3|nr:trem-like transcript 4 protein isoform X1 [Hyaena hyaena]
MTCQALPLLLVVLLLASGSWAQSQRDELVWAIEEQVLSVKCPSAPLLGEDQNKTWCKETKPGYCSKLVTPTSPQVMAQSPPHFIWDNPAAGFFIVIVTEITKKSSGAYRCGIDRGSAGGIIVLKNISLVVTAMTSSSTFNSGSEDCTPDNTFMVLLCGLLVIKILALTALLLFLTYRAQVSTGIVGIAVVAAPSPTKTPGPLRTPH